MSDVAVSRVVFTSGYTELISPYDPQNTTQSYYACQNSQSRQTLLT